MVTGASGARRPAAPSTVVIAELFTSEGCSSCPPADDLLRSLAASQPVEGVELVVLGSHVDYWDRLGWRDPFSSPLFSQRQSAYDAAVFRSNTIYTPQLVVDGALQCVGSDAAAVRRTVLEAAKQPKAAVTLSADVAPGGSGAASARVRVRFDIPDAVRAQPRRRHHGRGHRERPGEPGRSGREPWPDDASQRRGAVPDRSPGRQMGIRNRGRRYRRASGARLEEPPISGS